jgi:hypothetical protein
MDSRTMDTVQKHNYSNYHSPSSEPYRVYYYYYYYYYSYYYNYYYYYELN